MNNSLLPEPHLPFKFIKSNHELDGTFPHGIPNPIFPENQSATIPALVIQAPFVFDRYARKTNVIDDVDQINLEFGGRCFNLRGSNTELVIRLNVESRAVTKLMQTKADEILLLLGEMA